MAFHYPAARGRSKQTGASAILQRGIGVPSEVLTYRFRHPWV